MVWPMRISVAVTPRFARRRSTGKRLRPPASTRICAQIFSSFNPPCASLVVDGRCGPARRILRRRHSRGARRHQLSSARQLRHNLQRMVAYSRALLCGATQTDAWSLRMNAPLQPVFSFGRQHLVEDGAIYLTGMQALVRLMLDQEATGYAQWPVDRRFRLRLFGLRRSAGSTARWSATAPTLQKRHRPQTGAERGAGRHRRLRNAGAAYSAGGQI